MNRYTIEIVRQDGEPIDMNHVRSVMRESGYQVDLFAKGGHLILVNAIDSAIESLRSATGVVESVKGRLYTPDMDTDVLDRPVDYLDIEQRTRNCLSRLQIATVGELTKRHAMELKESRGFGPCTLRDVRRALSKVGLHLLGESIYTR